MGRCALVSLLQHYGCAQEVLKYRGTRLVTLYGTLVFTLGCREKPIRLFEGLLSLLKGEIMQYCNTKHGKTSKPITEYDTPEQKSHNL